MNNRIDYGWGLQRPTGEVMLHLVRHTRAEVIASVAEHFTVTIFKSQWRKMKRHGFKVVRVVVRTL